jgi:hypothetical protein
MLDSNLEINAHKNCLIHRLPWRNLLKGDKVYLFCTSGNSINDDSYQYNCP